MIDGVMGLVFGYFLGALSGVFCFALVAGSHSGDGDDEEEDDE